MVLHSISEGTNTRGQHAEVVVCDVRLWLEGQGFLKGSQGFLRFPDNNEELQLNVLCRG